MTAPRTEEARASETAMVFLGTHGGTTYPPAPWNGYAYAETDFAPEWVDLSDAEHDQCVTVLRTGLGECVTPEGWRVVYLWTLGEASCPWCGDGSGEEANRAQCALCEGDGLLYWGDDWEGVVFAPRYSYGSGSFGCLYDSGPHSATSIDDAIDGLIDIFGESLAGQDEEDAMRLALKENGTYRFASPGDAGADYCEVNDLS